MVEHGGSLTGVSSNMSWSYDAGCGVIVLCNTSDVPVSAIADAAMRMYHGRNPLEDRGLYQENHGQKRPERPQWAATFPARTPRWRIRENGDGVLAVVEGREKNLVMVQENLGIIRGYAKDAYLKLFKDENGGVFAIGFGGRMLPRK